MIYRKVTNIVEEQYEGCPENPEPMPFYERKNIKQLPPLIRYRFYSGYLWLNYLWYVNSTLEGLVNGSVVDSSLNTEKLITSAYDTSRLQRMVFGNPVGDQLGDLMVNFTRPLIDIAKAINVGAPIEPYRQKATDAITALANYLVTISPTTYTVNEVTTLFTNFVDHCVSRLQSIKSGTWAPEQDHREQVRRYTDLIAELMASGANA